MPPGALLKGPRGRWRGACQICERELLELSLRHSFTHFRPWAEFAHERQRINRRMGNLTFATKLFMDQMRHDGAELFGRISTQREELETTLDEQRNNLAHRTSLALRDQVQHHSFPERAYPIPSAVSR